MKIQPFKTEVFFSLYEFNAPFPLSCSDCETLSVTQLLELSGMTEEEFGALKLGYTEAQGDAELRSAIGTMYSNVSPDKVVILSSPVEGIYLTMRTLLEPGDEVISLSPAYDALNNLVEHICGRVIPWEIQPTAHGWALELVELEKKITDQTKLVIVNFPHNPTGYLPSCREFERLVEILDRYQVKLFCDEMYRGLEFEPTDKIPSAIESYSRSIVLSGLSKTYGLPGLRTGWLVIKDDDVREQLISWKHYTSICPAAPSEKLAVAALQCERLIRERNVELVKRNLEYAQAFFERWPDHFVWRRPDAGSVGLVELTEKVLGSSTVTEYCHQLVAKTGVFLLPGECLGCNGPFVRFGFGRQNFEDCLAEYEKHLCR